MGMVGGGKESLRAVAHRFRDLDKKLAEQITGVTGEPDLVHRARHQGQPAIAFGLADGKGKMTHPEPGMPALEQITLRAAETEDEEIGEPLLRALPIVGRIHRTDQIIRAHPPVKGRDETLESVFTEGFHHDRFHARANDSPDLTLFPAAITYPIPT